MNSPRKLSALATLTGPCLRISPSPCTQGEGWGGGSSKGKWRPTRFFIDAKVIAILVLSLCAATAFGDAITLHDGTRLEGKIHKDGDQWIVVDATGKETAVSPDVIESFELGSGHAADTPAQQLAALRSSADKLTDLNQIISRYQAFLKKNADDADTVAQAQNDLTQWKQRQAQGSVKVGSQWLTAAERDALVASEADAAAHVGDLIKQDRLQDAADAVKTALQLDPQDPSALYLNGLLLAKQNQNPPARTAFEQVNKIVPGHAASQNNLAIILWRQRLYAAAMNAYIQAMLANPNNKLILDNVAEALAVVPDENRDNPPVVKAGALFAQQDKVLQDAQLANGQSRWGATWVPTDELARLETEEQLNKQKIADLQDDFNRTKADIASDQSQIQIDQQQLTFAAQSMSTNQLNFQGPTVIQGLPQNFNADQLEQNMTVMKTAEAHSQEHLNHLNEQAARLQQNLTVPKYTGNQTLIGPEGNAPAFGRAGNSAGIGRDFANMESNHSTPARADDRPTTSQKNPASLPQGIADIPVALLAGGLATRLRPITQTIPKALAPVAGRPFIDHQLELLHRHGIRRVVLCLGYLGELVEEHLGDGSSRGMSLNYSYDGKIRLGTGGAIRRALSLLGDLFWVMYGDSYMDIDYRAVLAHFDANPTALGLMTVLRNGGQWDKSNVIFKDNKLIRYDKRNTSADMTYIDFGVALLRRAAADRIPDGPSDLANLYTRLVEEGSMIGYEVHNRFYEIGTPQSWAEADEYLRRVRAE